ncbi:MAG TPA: riboflavin synthase, partial [Aquella sp.]|nr:riboflavin synthase [Aquella sp.]
MFTGIIEELGTIGHIKTGSQSLELTILAQTVLNGIKLGDSIAVNGVCLTVTSFSDGQFTVDVMPETYNATSLAKIKVGSYVNLESSLR